jgi:hypothetical protein
VCSINLFDFYCMVRMYIHIGFGGFVTLQQKRKKKKKEKEKGFLKLTETLWGPVGTCFIHCGRPKGRAHMTKFCTVLGGREILFRICVHYMFPLGEISCKCNYCGTNLLCIYIYIF